MKATLKIPESGKTRFRVGKNPSPSREKSRLVFKEETVSLKRFLLNGNGDLDHQSQNRQNRDSATDGGFAAASLVNQNLNLRPRLGDALYEYRQLEPSVRTVNRIFDAGEGATEDEIVQLLDQLKAEGRYARTWEYFVVAVRDRFQAKRVQKQAQDIADVQQGKLATGKEPKGYDPDDPKYAAMTAALDGEFETTAETAKDISGEGGWVPPAKAAVGGALTPTSAEQAEFIAKGVAILREAARTGRDIPGDTTEESPEDAAMFAKMQREQAEAKAALAKANTEIARKEKQRAEHSSNRLHPEPQQISAKHQPASKEVWDKQTDKWIAIGGTQPKALRQSGITTAAFMAMSIEQRDLILVDLESKHQPARGRKGVNAA